MPDLITKDGIFDSILTAYLQAHGFKGLRWTQLCQHFCRQCDTRLLNPLASPDYYQGGLCQRIGPVFEAIQQVLLELIHEGKLSLATKNLPTRWGPELPDEEKIAAISLNLSLILFPSKQALHGLKLADAPNKPFSQQLLQGDYLLTGVQLNQRALQSFQEQRGLTLVSYLPKPKPTLNLAKPLIISFEDPQLSFIFDHEAQEVPGAIIHLLKLVMLPAELQVELYDISN